MFLGGCIGFCGGASPGNTEASLYVSDHATGQPIATPHFAENGQALPSECEQPMSREATACMSQLLFLPPAVHTIVVSADGYVAQTVTVDTTSLDSVHLAVEMTRAE